ncbi:MAG: methyltransferase domain-containing protein [Caldilineaceae bacterium SB0665_bin_21]|nr:methyltransferase domain-containing protein [Caldilineaceae bacterium SB0665_bin_21]MYC63285.1 methyltransferase domain-containing protein [Caldilineaceae bacterium SB0661_bin_34]
MKLIQVNEDLYNYLVRVTVKDHPALAALREETAAMPSGGMQIAAEQGQFMQLLVHLLQATRYLEVGCFTGYSSLVMAMALPEDGRVTTCDVSKEWTDVARRHWQSAGVADKITLKLGPAVDSLRRLLAEGSAESFDIAFIDADKDNYPNYYDLCFDLVRPGGLILIDNTLWGGQVVDPSVSDPDTEGIRAVNQRAFEDDRVDSCLLPLSDGLHICHKRR